MIGTRFDLTSRIGPAVTEHRLAATPTTCVWGYIDRATPPVLEVDPGDIIEIEAVTHHAGDAPDLLMDDGIREIWAGIDEADRGPGLHVLTGPIAVRGARPGDTLMVRILDMHPRLPFGALLPVKPSERLQSPDSRMTSPLDRATTFPVW